MPLSVADRGSNKNEQIVHAAEIIGRSKQRALVFREVYRGKRKTKTVVELAAETGLTTKQVLECGKKLASQDLIEQVKTESGTGYRKIDFFQSHLKKILNAAQDKKKREKIPTKRQHAQSSQIVIPQLSLPKTRVQAVKITVDDISSFKEVKKIGAKSLNYTNIPEKKFKLGVANILGEKGDFKDWGGESNDLYSSRLTINGKRRTVAFAFKGPGKTGKLTPKKMGKNGDQIQRLAKCAAEVLIVQYWNQIDDSVCDLLQSLAMIKSFMENKKIWYALIDGIDSTRLIKAYPAAFK